MAEHRREPRIRALHVGMVSGVVQQDANRAGDTACECIGTGSLTLQVSGPNGNRDEDEIIRSIDRSCGGRYDCTERRLGKTSREAGCPRNGHG